MSPHFSQLFWGQLVVFLNISINGFDLLADGIGYLIIAAGCSGLASQSCQFTKARSLCFVLFAMWLVGFAIPNGIALIYGICVAVVSCVFMWQLLGGIAELAWKYLRADLATRAENLRIAYVLMMIGTSMVAPLFLSSKSAGALVPMIAVTMLAVVAMTLHLIRRIGIEVAGELGALPDQP